MVSKNWKLFDARLSSFWLRKILLDRPKKKIFPTKKKKWSERMGRTPTDNVRAWDRATYSQFLNIDPVGHDVTIITSFDIP
jgi:hypothetical protein